MTLPDREHLHRLRNVWIKNPVYFLTICTAHRRKILPAPRVAEILVESWHAAAKVHGWMIGRYVIMPDHVHFFAAPGTDAKSLSAFLRDWKKWTAREIAAALPCSSPVWQPEFFDHILRSQKSYSEKWEYVRLNPVRAGLVADAEAWPHSGECRRLSF